MHYCYSSTGRSNVHGFLLYIKQIIIVTNILNNIAYTLAMYLTALNLVVAI